MKKSVIFILIIFSFPLVSSLEFNLDKETYHPQETLLATLKANFVENPKAEDIFLYSGRLKVPVIYDLAKIQNSFYIYLILPLEPRNYTLLIKNAHYLEDGKTKKQDLKLNFSVQENVADFYVIPGFVTATDDFSVKVFANSETEIKAKFLEQNYTITLLSGQKKKLTFSIKSVQESSLEFIHLSSDSTSYKIPVLISPKTQNKTQQQNQLRFNKNKIALEILVEKNWKSEIKIYNPTQEDIEDIEIKEDLDILKISPDKIDKLESGEEQTIDLIFNSDELGKYEGELQAEYENVTIIVPISIDVKETEEELPVLDEAEEAYAYQTCEEKGGHICAGEEICDGELTSSYDGSCCLGECKEEEKNNTRKFIGIAIIFAVLSGVAFFLYRRMKKKPKSSKELLKDKTEKYQSRFKPKEIRGKIEKG